MDIDAFLDEMVEKHKTERLNIQSKFRNQELANQGSNITLKQLSLPRPVRKKPHVAKVTKAMAPDASLDDVTNRNGPTVKRYYKP